MTPHLLSYAIWAAAFSSKAIMAVVLFSHARRWPFLLALMVFDLIHSSLLLATLHHYTSYFYTYWIGQGLRSLLSVGLLWDVLRNLPAMRFLPRRIGIFLLTFALTITAGAVFIAALSSSHTYPLTDMVLTLERCATVAWMSLAACILCAVSFLGMGWTLEGVNITAGFVVSGMAAMLAASLISSYPAHGHLIDQLHTAIDISVLSYWFTCLYCSRPEIASDCLNPNQLFKERTLV